MRALLTTQPGTGHFNTLVPVARALVAAGHEVAVCSPPKIAAEVERAGFRHVPCGFDWHLDYPERGLPNVPPPGPERVMWVLTDLFAGLTAEAAIEGVEREVSRWKPDIVVREPAEYAGCLVAEHEGLPHACVGHGAAMALYGMRHLLAEPLGRLRDQLGLPLDDDVEMPYRHLFFLGMPPSFERARVELPPTARYLGFTLPPPDPGDIPDWLEELDGDRPLVFASLGTVSNHIPGALEAVLHGLREEDVELVMAVGRDHETDAFGPQPDNVHLVQFIRQTSLLPRCDMFVTHAGFVSMRDGFAAGTPMVAVPLNSDQPYYAQRIDAIGAGVQVKPSERTAERVNDAARRTLADPGCAERTREIGEELARMPTPDDAVALLEQLARDGALAHA